ncbi:hypothetical protein WA158_005346 [Blastocystis sp. Blastoise]
MFTFYGEKGKQAVNDELSTCKLFKNSSVVPSRSYELWLIKWLGKDKTWKLLFRASEHEYKASEFHKYCDNKGETVTIIKHKGHGKYKNIFGGYTNNNWDSENDCKSYSKEFLFTLSNEHGILPTKYNYISRNTQYGIFCGFSFGPVFGAGTDIYISDQCHTNNYSYCNACYYGEVNTYQQSKLFVNTESSKCENHFIVEDYEVWGRE